MNEEMKYPGKPEENPQRSMESTPPVDPEQSGSTAASDDAEMMQAMIDESEHDDEQLDRATVGMPTDPLRVQRAEFGDLDAAETGKSPQGNIGLLLDVSLPVAIELGRTQMSIKEILDLGAGSIVELDKLAGEPVDVLINSRPLAKGEVVVLDEHFGVRITSLVSTRERLENLGA